MKTTEFTMPEITISYKDNVAQFSTGILAHFSISIYSSCDFPSYLSFPHGLLEMKRGYSSCPVIFYIQKVNAQS